VSKCQRTQFFTTLRSLSVVSNERQPDFRKLFPREKARTGEEEPGWDLSARAAYALYVGLLSVADYLYDDAQALGNDPITTDNVGRVRVLGDLPSFTWGRDEQWRRQLARAGDDLAADLAAGSWPDPRCTAEEVVLHLGIQSGEGNWHDDDFGTDLPDDADFDWEECYEFFFQDTDFLFLFNPRFDGLESSTLAEEHGSVNLHPDRWFEPFGNAEPRDPDRGFRR
jgi:hypothetical protein